MCGRRRTRRLIVQWQGSRLAREVDGPALPEEHIAVGVLAVENEMNGCPMRIQGSPRMKSLRLARAVFSTPENSISICS